MSLRGVRIASPAKINLYLDVLGKRPDGFHEVLTVMTALNLCDMLILRRAPRGIRLSVTGADIPANEDNLAFRAAALFMKQNRLRAGVQIHLEKKIPAAAGLGGGSSNAACTLLAMNALFGRPWNLQQLLEAAASLGSDVPFFLRGCPSVGIGKGSDIIPLGGFIPLHVVLAGPRGPFLAHKTARVYQAWKKPLTKPSPPISITLASIETKDANNLGKSLHNALEKAACTCMPFSAHLRRFMQAQNALGVLISGAGPSVFALMRSGQEALRLKQKIDKEFGSSTWVGVYQTLRRTPNPKPYIK